MRRRLTAAALLLSVVLAGGCGSSAGTAADASPDDARVTALAEEAFRQLPPGATLDPRDDRQAPVLRVEHPGGFRIAASLVRPEHGRVAAYLVSSSTCR